MFPYQCRDDDCFGMCVWDYFLLITLMLVGKLCDEYM